MSLLDKWTHEIVVYPEVEYVDADGNKMRRPAKQGIPAKARLQRYGMSGTSANRIEEHETGFMTEERYTMRMPRRYEKQIGSELLARSRIEIDGESWSVVGNPINYTSSRRTAHKTYTIVRD